MGFLLECARFFYILTTCNGFFKASNPGQFDTGENEVHWQRGQTGSSIYHPVIKLFPTTVVTILIETSAVFETLMILFSGSRRNRHRQTYGNFDGRRGFTVYRYALPSVGWSIKTEHSRGSYFCKKTFCHKLFIQYYTVR